MWLSSVLRSDKFIGINTFCNSGVCSSRNDRDVGKSGRLISYCITLNNARHEWSGALIGKGSMLKGMKVCFNVVCCWSHFSQQSRYFISTRFQLTTYWCNKWINDQQNQCIQLYFSLFIKNHNMNKRVIFRNNFKLLLLTKRY